MADAREYTRNPDFLNSVFGLETKRRKKRNLEWSSDLPECEIGDYRIIPLTTSRQLRAEGREMKHCVGQYDELCHIGRVRIFSIQNQSGNRLATASLIWRNDYWHLEQVKGYDNAEVLEAEERCFSVGKSTLVQIEPPEIYFVCQELLQRYRSVWSKQLKNYVCNLLSTSLSSE